MKHLMKLSQVPEDLRDGVSALASRRIAKLRRMLTPAVGEEPFLHLIVKPTEGSANRWTAMVTLKAEPWVTEARATSSADPRFAVKEAFDEMEMRLKVYLREDRQQRRAHRKHQEQESLRDVQNGLSNALAGEREDEFDLLLRPRVDSLRRSARRMLDIIQAEGHDFAGTVLVEDLINETLLTAWEERSEKPEGLPMDLWLSGLLIRVFEEAIKNEEKYLPLSDAVRKEREDDEDEDYDPELGSDRMWWSQVDQLDAILWDDLLPSDDESDAFSRLSYEEAKYTLLLALGKLGPVERNAIMLYALEGYDMEEILQILRISDSSVAEIIEGARSKLREHLG